MGWVHPDVAWTSTPAHQLGPPWPTPARRLHCHCPATYVNRISGVRGCTVLLRSARVLGPEPTDARVQHHDAGATIFRVVHGLWGIHTHDLGTW